MDYPGIPTTTKSARYGKKGVGKHGRGSEPQVGLTQTVRDMPSRVEPWLVGFPV